MQLYLITFYNVTIGDIIDANQNVQIEANGGTLKW